MKSSRFCVLTVCVALGAASVTLAAEPVSNFPSMSPFSKKRMHTTTITDSEKGSRGLQLPKLDLWPSHHASSHRRRQPSAWTRFNQGAKAFFAKAKEALMAPWNSLTKTNRTSGHAHASHVRHTERKPKKKSIFASWLKPKEDRKKPKSVTDFLNQPRPGF